MPIAVVGRAPKTLLSLSTAEGLAVEVSEYSEYTVRRSLPSLVLLERGFNYMFLATIVTQVKKVTKYQNDT